MPQRTRKEKIAATQRREEQKNRPTYTVEYKKVARFDQTEIVKANTVKKSEVIAKLEPKQQAYELATHQYFLHDFKKSVFFILIIFAIEIFLYFARIGNYLVR